MTELPQKKNPPLFSRKSFNCNRTFACRLRNHERVKTVCLCRDDGLNNLSHHDRRKTRHRPPHSPNPLPRKNNPNMLVLLPPQSKTKCVDTTKSRNHCLHSRQKHPTNTAMHSTRLSSF